MLSTRWPSRDFVAVSAMRRNKHAMLLRMNTSTFQTHRRGLCWKDFQGHRLIGRLESFVTPAACQLSGTRLRVRGEQQRSWLVPAKSTWVLHSAFPTSLRCILSLARGSISMIPTVVATWTALITLLMSDTAI